MFIGHFGLGLAAKKINPRPSLGTTFLAAQFIDLLWPFFLMLGMEKVEVEPGNTVFTPLNFVSYPYSHSLAAVLVWALLFGIIYYLIKKDRGSALLLAALVISHWLLDLLTHRPDLPLSFSEQHKMGFGLWNSKMGTIIIEMLIFSLGCFLYINSTTAKNKAGNIALWSFIVFMIVMYLMNAFGPPPESASAIPYIGLAQWILIAWGYWIDANRGPRILTPISPHV